MFTKARGREVIFWQSARTAKQARPNVSLPTARAAGQRLEIIVDTKERYAWTFGHQQALTTRRRRAQEPRRRHVIIQLQHVEGPLDGAPNSRL